MRLVLMSLVLLMAASAEAEEADAGAPVMADAGTDAGSLLPGDVTERLDAVLAPAVVGEVLATSVLGNSELEPVRPGSVPDLLTAIQAFNKEGKLAPGVAVELTPWAFGAASDVTYQSYVQETSPWKRWYYRSLLHSSLSLATVSEGEGDEAVVRAAAGLRIRLWDDSDWRLNTAFVSCALKIPERLPKALPEPDPDKPPLTEDGITEGEPASEDYLKEFDKCLEEHKRAWNAGQGAFGLAATMRAPRGDLELSELERLEAILGMALPLGRRSQLVYSLRLARAFPLEGIGEQPAVPARTLVGVGARLVFKAERFILNLNTGLGREHTHQDDYWKGLAGLLVQVKLAESIWVESSLDATFVGSGRPGSLAFDTSLKWAYDLTPKKL